MNISFKKATTSCDVPNYSFQQETGSFYKDKCPINVQKNIVGMILSYITFFLQEPTYCCVLLTCDWALKNLWQGASTLFARFRRPFYNNKTNFHLQKATWKITIRVSWIACIYQWWIIDCLLCSHDRRAEHLDSVYYYRVFISTLATFFFIIQW